MYNLIIIFKRWIVFQNIIHDSFTCYKTFKKLITIIFIVLKFVRIL